MDKLKSLRLWLVGRYAAFVLYFFAVVMFFKSWGVAFCNGVLRDLGSVLSAITFMVFGIGILLHMALEYLRRMDDGERQ